MLVPLTQSIVLLLALAAGLLPAICHLLDAHRAYEARHAAAAEDTPAGALAEAGDAA